MCLMLRGPKEASVAGVEWVRRRVGGGERSEVTGQSRACMALWAIGVGVEGAGWLAFVGIKWEPQKILNRGGTCPDSGAHRRPLAAVCGETGCVREAWWRGWEKELCCWFRREMMRSGSSWKRGGKRSRQVLTGESWNRIFGTHSICLHQRCLSKWSCPGDCQMLRSGAQQWVLDWSLTLKSLSLG